MDAQLLSLVRASKTPLAVHQLRSMLARPSSPQQPEDRETKRPRLSPAAKDDEAAEPTQADVLDAVQRLCEQRAIEHKLVSENPRLELVWSALAVWPTLAVATIEPLPSAPAKETPMDTASAEHSQEAAVQDSGKATTPTRPTISTPSKTTPGSRHRQFKRPGAFVSPMSAKPVSRETVVSNVKSKHAELEAVERELAQLDGEYSIQELQDHITKLHEYNEIKDAGQIVLGRLAEIRNVTTKAMYAEFELSLDD
ncbi:hypothetical protein CAOG_03879 [Capsaspora owczarzaki ATCC 30864]|uniref:DNA repair protein SWI5 homolog n=1 Tax=Capsaspora owczarzaki (strain ATCC 30864) TaxID=595528 RepID=A0A0D2UD77_CAPO3|nr:hypothetical protein CAOG_03879 [Capsaspora owczarzaki ATCC 30864]KJE93016.1 hypothetical protein CAOG_003879 [Capsaspora owczarzaki ATCC 30864]|eukprot:XP_004363607.2 hypothetical protein CAOG_03879 [Capsaspora owczarzaki ATCC 30864]